MKKIYLIIIAVILLFGCTKKNEGVLRIHEGMYAFCGASGAKPTGRKIIIQGVEFEEGCSTCPVLTGPSISNLSMRGMSPSWDSIIGDGGKFSVDKEFQYPGNDGSTIWDGKSVWSLYWYFDSTSLVPQYNPATKDWEMMTPSNRKFTVDTKHPATSESNMFCMPCQIIDTTEMGIILAKCYGPLNEAAIPLRKAIPVKNGMTSITAAIKGKPYPVGTPIPVNK